MACRRTRVSAAVAALRLHRDHRRCVEDPARSRLAFVELVVTAGEGGRDSPGARGWGRSASLTSRRPSGSSCSRTSSISSRRRHRWACRRVRPTDGRASCFCAVRPTRRTCSGDVDVHPEAHAGVREAAVLGALAEERPARGCGRPAIVSRCVRPGTTSCLPASSGIQKLWITLQTTPSAERRVARA